MTRLGAGLITYSQALVNPIPTPGRRSPCTRNEMTTMNAFLLLFPFLFSMLISVPVAAENVLIIGDPHKIGYHAALRFLGECIILSVNGPDCHIQPDEGSNVAILLHDKSIANCTKLQPYIESGQARLIEGEPLLENDIRLSWTEAAREGAVDILLFTAGE